MNRLFKIISWRYKLYPH